jgi:hypothetical protein
MSVFICSASLDKIVSNHVKDSCIILINVCSCGLFAEIFWRFHTTSGRLDVCHFRHSSVFCGAAGLSFPCLDIFVK